MDEKKSRIRKYCISCGILTDGLVDSSGLCLPCATFGETYGEIGNVLPEIVFTEKETEAIAQDEERIKTLRNPVLFKEVLKRYASFQPIKDIIAVVKTVTGTELTPFRINHEVSRHKNIVDAIRTRANGALGDIPIASLNHRMQKMNDLLAEADELEGAEKIQTKVRLLSEAHKMTDGSKITVDKKETKTLRVVLERISSKNKALPERLGRDISAFMKKPELAAAHE